MKELIRLWKTNAVIVAVQIPVGIGLWFFTTNAPKSHTPIEALGGTLFLLALLTVLFGILSAYATLTKKPPLVGPFAMSLASGFGLGVAVAIGHEWTLGRLTNGLDLTTGMNIVAYGGMAIALYTMSIFTARRDDTVKAPWWVYAITALPWGIGVVGFPLLLLARKLLSSR